MQDLNVLKQRVEQAEQRLKASQASRRHEGEVLMRVWGDIRARLESQESDIAEQRRRAAALQELNDGLCGLVDTLLTTVEQSFAAPEGSVAQQISEMARAMLATEPAAPPVASDPAAWTAPAAFDDGTTIPEPAEQPPGEYGALRDDADPPFAAYAEAAPETEEILDLVNPVAPPPLAANGSMGIMNLITRLEGSVAGKGARRRSTAKLPTRPEGEAAGHERDDIERLREELVGLRSKLAAGT